jgi:catechol-2,3-dioxygenase
VNEWRGQSADRERSQQEELAKLTSQFSLREVVDAQITDLRRSLEDLRDKVNKVV